MTNYILLDHATLPVFVLFKDRTIISKNKYSYFLDQMKSEMKLDTFQTYLEDTRYHSWDNGTLKISCQPEALDWLTARVSVTARRQLSGYFGEILDIQFIAEVQNE